MGMQIDTGQKIFRAQGEDVRTIELNLLGARVFLMGGFIEAAPGIGELLEFEIIDDALQQRGGLLGLIFLIKRAAINAFITISVFA